MDTLSKLTDLFRRFPGIGPRQARRFVHFLLAKDQTYVANLAKTLASLKAEIAQCSSCYRFFEKRAGTLCSLCADPNRSDAELMVIAHDTDAEAIEKSGSYGGRYFILGGTLSPLEKKPAEPVRKVELANRVKRDGAKGSLREIILALSANPDGEYTSLDIRRELSPLAAASGIKISVLGRGLSTGSELEYADADTIKNALRNRFKVDRLDG